MQARYQHPVTGRFLSVDPVSFLADGRTGMVNRYSYTLNDPVNGIDPDGRACIPCGAYLVYRGAKIAHKGYKAVKAARAANKAVQATAAVAIASETADQGALAAMNEKSEVRGEGVRPTDEPVDLEEQLAGEEILGELAEGGGENMSEGMGDERYNPVTGTHDKVRGDHKHPDGTTTEVHGDRDRATGELSDTKFKDPPDNNKSRSTFYGPN